ncbi:MAG: glycosyl hydrolase [Paludibacter sp.]|nr:glycosyl hydrolase [Paludibacter sp.]
MKHTHLISLVQIFSVFVLTFFFSSCSKSSFDDTNLKIESKINNDTLTTTKFNATTLSGSKIVAPASGCYTGVALWQVEFNISLLDTWITKSGKKPNFVMYFSHWADTYDKDFNTTGCEAISSRGCIPYITWCPASDGGGVTQPLYKLTNITAGNFDTYITTYANAIKSWGKPVLLRFGMEMNMDVFPWSGNVNGNNDGSDYVDAWKHVHDIFQNVGVTNVTWFWCPYVESMWAGWPNMLNFYPGAQYVDWVGVDGYGYNPSSWATNTFDGVFQSSYNKLLTLGKPMMIGEIAAGEYKQGRNWKANWETDAFTKLKSNYTEFKGYTWFNYNKEEDWRIESTTTSLNAYTSKTKLDSYFLSGN